jgi:hypothetical protein
VNGCDAGRTDVTRQEAHLMSISTDIDAPGAALDRVRTAAARLYDAECALHIAHQTQVDEWIAAASDRLHDATAEHRAARADYLAACADLRLHRVSA